MASSFKSILQCSWSWDAQEDDGSGRTVVDRNSIPLIGEIANDETDTHVVIHERRTLTTGSTKSYDLAGGVVDHFGNFRTLTGVKGILVKSLSTSLSAIIEVGGGSNAFASWLGASGDLVVVNPSGLFLKYEPLLPYVVTAGTGDILLVTAQATAEYDIAIIGTV